MNERWSRSVSSRACRRARSASNPRVRQRTKRPSRSCVRRSGRPTDSGRRFVEPAYGLRTGSTGVGSARCRARPHLDIIWGVTRALPYGALSRRRSRVVMGVYRKQARRAETRARPAESGIVRRNWSSGRDPPHRRERSESGAGSTPTGRSPPGTARFRASPAGARRRTAQLRAARKRA